MNPIHMALAAGAALATLNTAVSTSVIRSDGLAMGQKMAQVVLVWVIPVLGAVLLAVFMWTQRGRAPATAYRPIPHERQDHIRDAVTAPSPARQEPE